MITIKSYFIFIHPIEKYVNGILINYDTKCEYSLKKKFLDEYITDLKLLSSILTEEEVELNRFRIDYKFFKDDVLDDDYIRDIYLDTYNYFLGYIDNFKLLKDIDLGAFSLIENVENKSFKT